MNNITNWQNAMEALPDDSFFNIIRLYLGDVKTPYNKQRLISQLAAFIRDKNNLNNMLLLLDDFDFVILTSISILTTPDQKTLIDFLSTTYQLPQIYTRILNLTERLFIYTDTQTPYGKQIIRINPLIIEELKPFLKINRILPESHTEFYSMDDVFIINPNFLAAFISFIKINGCSCKANGILKKNVISKLEESFPGKINCLQLIFNAFVNTGILHEGPKFYVFDNTKLENFSKLTEIQQYAFLCAAAFSRLSRDGLKKQAQLLIDCLSSIPKNGFTKKILLRLSFLVGSRIDDSSAFGTKTRFAQILENAKPVISSPKALNSSTSQENSSGKDSIEIFDRMLDTAIEFGLLTAIGKNENNETVYITNENLLNKMQATMQNYSPAAHLVKNNENSKTIPVLNIDSTFTVSVMPGLSLNQLLPLTSFLEIKSCNVVTEFEINRKSVSFAFDEGQTPKTISDYILKYSLYDLPQNLQISIEDWYNSYSSAMLYKGYILKVAAENISFVENNPKINYLIKEKLAEGIYLLSIPEDADITAFMTDCGLDFMGSVRTASTKKDTIAFPLLRSPKALVEENHLDNIFDNSDTIDKACKTADKSDETKAEEIIKLFLDEVEKMKLIPQQKENLISKIKNKKIVSLSQLKNTSLKTEILETDGMDFGGKIHLLEAAIENGDLVELQLPSPKFPGKFDTFIGHPIQLIKQTGEPFIHFMAENSSDKNENEAITITVSKISHIRRLRF